MEMSAVLIILVVAWTILVLWASLDAFAQTDLGCMWVSLFVCCSPLAVPVYLFMRFYTNRPATREELQRRQFERDQVTVSRFPSEIEKARYIAAADQPHGTLYEPEAVLGIAGGGFRHFTDERAEELLRQRRFSEAFEYLADLYSVAAESHDGRAQDTFRFYIAQIPAGLELLRERNAGPGSDETGPPRHVRRDDDMPF